MTYLQRVERFEEALGEARSRSDADRALVRLLAEAFDPLSRTLVVAALGDVTGASGVPASLVQFAEAKEDFAAAAGSQRSA